MITNNSKQLIRYADDFIACFNLATINPYDTKHYKALTKARKAYFKRIKHDCFEDSYIDCGEDLSAFAIPFSDIPTHLFMLMERIRWVHRNSKEPLLNSKLFYCSKWHDANDRGTSCEWFIDFDKYIDLLHVYNDLTDWFLGDISTTANHELARVA